MSSDPKGNEKPAETGPLIPDFIGRQFVTKEFDPLKRKVNDLSISVNGISASLDVVKLGLGAVALGLTPVKIDATGFKVDEKGGVFFGRQLWVWPHAKDDKAKLEAAQNKADRKAQKFQQHQLSSSLIYKEKIPKADTNHRNRIARDLKSLRKAQREWEKANRDVNKIQANIDKKAKEVAKTRADALRISGGMDSMMRGTAKQVGVLTRVIGL
ncbi:hypothetical protein [Streptomyces syringium]|uniref:hypothetical protein n=1 Tax=Streptomyces syringium TaxID=76729 RepID=UPI003AB0E5D5